MSTKVSAMSETRDRIYRYLRDRLLEGAPPTLREVQAAIGLRAVESVRSHLEALVSQGLLVKRPGSRGYSLPNVGAPRVHSVPIVGRVQAGAFATAVEDVEGFLSVEGNRPEELFGLRVRGESMVGAGIFPEDILLVRKQSTAREGEIVVALVEDEATVKRLRFRGGRPELHPENPDFSVLTPNPQDLQILGKVIEVRRYFEGRP